MDLWRSDHTGRPDPAEGESFSQELPLFNHIYPPTLKDSYSGSKLLWKTAPFAPWRIQGHVFKAPPTPSSYIKLAEQVTLVANLEPSFVSPQHRKLLRGPRVCRGWFSHKRTPAGFQPRPQLSEISAPVCVTNGTRMTGLHQWPHTYYTRPAKVCTSLLPSHCRGALCLLFGRPSFRGVIWTPPSASNSHSKAFESSHLCGRVG